MKKTTSPIPYTVCIKKHATPQWDLFNVLTKKHASFIVIFVMGHAYVLNFNPFKFKNNSNKKSHAP